MVEWSRIVVIGLQKREKKKKIRKVELTGLGLVTGQIGEKGGREKSNIIFRFLNLAAERMMVPTYYFPSVGNIDKILKILLFSLMYTDIKRAKTFSDLILANMIFIF